MATGVCCVCEVGRRVKRASELVLFGLFFLNLLAVLKFKMVE